MKFKSNFKSKIKTKQKKITVNYDVIIKFDNMSIYFKSDIKLITKLFRKCGTPI